MLLQRYPLLRNARFWSLLLLQLLVLFQSPTPFTQALTSTLSAALQRPVPPFTSSFLTATAQNVIYDGPEWTSLQECLNCRNAAADCGRMTIVVGTTKEGGDKVVGVVVAEQEKVDEKKRHKTVELNENNYKIYKESMAVLPAKIKDQDAIQTMIAALSGVYCTVPKVEGVGGAEKDESKMAVQGKVVVLGSSDFARFAAEGIAAMGSSVTLVSTKKPSVRNKSIQVVPPAIGDDDTGFASYIGEFDALLDTAQNERPSRRGMFTTSDDDDDGTTTDMGSSMVLKLLKDRHKCERYISSMTQAQNIIYRDGVFFGPGKVKEHFANLQEKYKSRPAMFETIIPPASFGQTVQTLLENDIVYKSSKEFLTGNKNNVIARGWSLSDFMEVNMWPQNSAGGGTRSVRYGFPVLEEVEDDMLDAMISAPPETADQKFIAKDKWDEDIEREERKRDEVDQRNPYVRKIVGAKQLHEHIVKDEKDAVLFMSATWCRTCRSLNPKFTYMARQTSEKNEENSKKILFAKADTTGEIGKDLGRLLNVDSVPAFLLFRKGRRFGPPLSISKMPSKKLKVAIELLESGLDWDSNSIKEAEKKSR